jgi:iron(III) transport system ATP-binding protein
VIANGTSGPAHLLVRPEQIRLQDTGRAGVAARVTEISFYGHDASIQLDLSSGQRVVARVFGREVPAVGTAVHLRVEGPVTVFADGRAS